MKPLFTVKVMVVFLGFFRFNFALKKDLMVENHEDDILGDGFGRKLAEDYAL